MLVVLAGAIAVGLPEPIRRGRETGHDVVVAFDPFHSIAGVAFLLLYIGTGTWLGKRRTPGKWVMGLRVVSLSRERLTLWQCLERALGYGVSALDGGSGFFQAPIFARG